MVEGTEIRKGDVMVMVGTRKGAFLLSGDGSRDRWRISGPHCADGDVFHMTYDPRNGALLAAMNNVFWGSQVQIGTDLGATWTASEGNPKISDGSELALGRIWHIEPGRANEPGVLYLGAEPASLFRSHDWGANWEQFSSLTRHPSRDRWEEGNGGLCLHSIVLDRSSKQRMWVGISAAGTFRTDDGGETWEPKNLGVRADFLPETFPEFGQCPHKMLSHPAHPEVLYQQNHCGVFRSDEAGDNWRDVTEGLPSRFGFVLGVHSQDPDTIFVMPEDSAQGDQIGGNKRYVTDASMRIYRSKNGGGDWEPLTNDLPPEHAYLHTMREGMATDDLDSCGVYVGTTSGEIFNSRDAGDSWQSMVRHLPPINSVEGATVV